MGLGSRVGVHLEPPGCPGPAVRGAEASAPCAPVSLLSPGQFHFASRHQSSSSTPTVTPPSVQPVSPPTVVSTSLAADLEGLTLTDSPLVPSVSGMGQEHRSVLRPMVWLCVEGL